jgi:hypothetical protein
MGKRQKVGSFLFALPPFAPIFHIKLPEFDELVLFDVQSKAKLSRTRRKVNKSKTLPVEIGSLIVAKKDLEMSTIRIFLEE